VKQGGKLTLKHIRPHTNARPVVDFNVQRIIKRCQTNFDPIRCGEAIVLLLEQTQVALDLRSMLFGDWIIDLHVYRQNHGMQHQWPAHTEAAYVAVEELLAESDAWHRKTGIVAQVGRIGVV
jgi:hypothetical protein